MDPISPLPKPESGVPSSQTPTGAAGQESPAAGLPPFAPTARPVVARSSGRTFAWLWFLLAGIGWFCFLIAAVTALAAWMAGRDYFDTSGGIQEKYHSLAKGGKYKVAIIEIKGLIMDGDGFVKRQIDRVRKDDKVKAVVVRVDSPGGTVTGSDYILHHLKKLKKEKDIPIVVSMGGMAASGGYYVSMAVGDEKRSIFAEPTTTTGSIGVIIPHYDLSGLLARFDVKDDSITSGPHKQLLSMTKQMSPEDRKVITAYLMEAFGRFKEIVKEGRPAFRNDEAALDDLATGEIFTAEQAKNAGLVDEIGWIEDAIDRALDLANLQKDEVRVVQYRRVPTLVDQLIGVHQKRPHALDAATLMEMTTPRAYYLCTWLPPALSVHRQ